MQTVINRTIWVTTIIVGNFRKVLNLVIWPGFSKVAKSKIANLNLIRARL